MADRDSTYKIVRKHTDNSHYDHNRVIKKGLTLEEAQAHCNDPTTHGEDWMDCYYEENARPKPASFLDKVCMLQTKDPSIYLGA